MAPPGSSGGTSPAAAPGKTPVASPGGTAADRESRALDDLARGLGSGDKDRGLFPANPDFEDVDAAEDETESELGCDKVPYFDPQDDLSDEEIRRLVAMTSMYYVPGMDGTPCLFKMARSIQNNLLPIARRKPRIHLQMLQRLIDLYKEVKTRTEKPYRIGFDTVNRKPLSKDVLDYWPFSEYELWVEDATALRKGRAVFLEPINLVEKKEKIEADESQQAELERALMETEKRLSAISLTGTGLDNTPQVKEAVATLSAMTLKHINKQTGSKINPAYDDIKLIKSTEVILFHSVHTVVLDRQGEPTTLNGRLDYPILIPPPGSVMERNLHSPGLYISLRKLAGGDFKLGEKGEVTKILMSGIGSLIENHGGGVRVPHDFQVTIQNYLDFLGYSYAAALVVESAYKPQELSVAAVKRKFPQLVEATFPYAVKEMGKKARHLFKNWDEVAKQVGEEALKEVIKEKVKDKLISYLIKKIGVKIIPLVNIASALYDLFEGEAERMRVRNAIGCIILHVKGSSKDDLHIAAKTLAKILADKFEDAIMDALVKKAVDGGMKLKRRKPGEPDPDAGKPPKPADQPSDQGEAAKRTDTPTDVPTADKPAGQGTDKPANPAKGTDATATEKPATGDSGTGDPGTAKKGTQEGGTKPDQKPEARTEGKEEGKAEGKPESKPEMKPEPKPEEKAETKSEPKRKAQEKPGKESEAEPELETQAAPKKGQAAKGAKKKEAKKDEDVGETGETGEPKSGKKPKGKKGEPDEGDKPARATDKPGTEDNGTAPDPKDVEKKKAKKHRDRKKKIGVMARLKQRWGAQAKVILTAISQRERLRQAWKSVASHLFAHHLVPVTVLKQHEVAQAAVVGGYDFNGKTNGALLTHPEHAGGHNEYNQIIMDEMTQFAKDNPGYSPKDARDFIEGRVKVWRDMYLSQAGEYIPDPDDPTKGRR